MTSKQDFTDEEWTRVRRAPLVAGVAISLADPGGPIEVAKETMASLRSATLPPSQEELLAAVVVSSMLGVAVFLFFGWLQHRIIGKWSEPSGPPR